MWLKKIPKTYKNFGKIFVVVCLCVCHFALAVQDNSQQNMQDDLRTNPQIDLQTNFQENFPQATSQNISQSLLQSPQDAKDIIAQDIANEENIKEYILSQYKALYPHFELESISIDMPKSLNPKAKIRKLSLPSNATKKPSGTIIATILQGKGVVSVPIGYHIYANVLIVQATLSIKTGTDITQQNTQTQWISLSAIKGNPLPPQEIGNVSARSLIPPNSIITRDKVQERILVRKGDKITGLYKSQSMQAQIALKALQNGSKGNIIKAQNLQSGKILQVRIVDEGVGEIL